MYELACMKYGVMQDAHHADLRIPWRNRGRVCRKRIELWKSFGQTLDAIIQIIESLIQFLVAGIAVVHTRVDQLKQL